MTNADKIRAITDEELAMMLYKVSWKIDTEQEWLDWLKHEMSDNG